MRKRALCIGAALFLTVLSALGLFRYYQTQTTLTYNDFQNALAGNQVEEVIYSDNENYIEVKLTGKDGKFKIPNPGSDDFMDTLLSSQVKITYADTSGGSLVGQIVLAAVIIGGAVYFHRRQRNSDLIKEAKQDSKNIIPLTLTDIAGNIEAKAMVEDIIGFIKNPEKYTDLGAEMPRGILFYGPPGTGKTLMAKAIAGEAGVPFYPMSGSDFIQTYVGVGASRVRNLFSKAKKMEKAVIFIDEIDAIGKKRSAQPGPSNDERDQTLNALLTEMSGFNERKGIVVIAATNRLDTLDEALTRPGRFDRLVEIGLPDINARKKILELHAKKKAISECVNLDEVAKSTVSFSGAMLENLLNEAAIIAANEEQRFIEPNHIDKAFYTVVAGAEKADTSYITAKDRKVTAYHEAGHALMTKLLLPDSYISKVTIIPSASGAGGFSLSIPKDTLYLTKGQMLANIKVLLAGRASEELIFGADGITSGASNDIEKASAYIADYITRYGMDEEYGIFNSLGIAGSPSPQLLDVYRSRLNLIYTETKECLENNMASLHSVANALVEKESLSDGDMEALCA